MLLQEEKQRVDSVSKLLIDPLSYAFDKFDDDDLVSVYKSLANVATTIVSKTDVGAFTLRNQVEKLAGEDIQKAVVNILIQLIQTGAHTESLKENRYYSTSDFADAMGVTLATVSNWIKSGRLIGVEKAGKGKHALIPDKAIYVNNYYQKFTVKEIMDSYERTIEEYMELPEETPEEGYRKINAHYIKKYRGSYFETLAKKKELNSQEQRDKAEWEYVLEEMGFFDGESEE